MDTFSHAAWGYAALRGARKDSPTGQSQRRIRWWGAALAGAAPDLLFAIPLAVERLLGIAVPPDVSPGPDIWRADGPPLPQYLVDAYERYYIKSHSFVLLGAACAAVALARRRRHWLWLAVPYALHIAMDIPTHERFQTQPLWPISSWKMQGLAWGDPRIFFPNVAVLLGVYLWLWKSKRI